MFVLGVDPATLEGYPMGTYGSNSWKQSLVCIANTRNPTPHDRFLMLKAVSGIKNDEYRRNTLLKGIAAVAASVAGIALSFSPRFRNTSAIMSAPLIAHTAVDKLATYRDEITTTNFARKHASNEELAGARQFLLAEIQVEKMDTSSRLKLPTFDSILNHRYYPSSKSSLNKIEKELTKRGVDFSNDSVGPYMQKAKNLRALRGKS